MDSSILYAIFALLILVIVYCIYKYLTSSFTVPTESISPPQREAANNLIKQINELTVQFREVPGYDKDAILSLMQISETLVNMPQTYSNYVALYNNIVTYNPLEYETGTEPIDYKVLNQLQKIQRAIIDFGLSLNLR